MTALALTLVALAITIEVWCEIELIGDAEHNRRLAQNDSESEPRLYY